MHGPTFIIRVLKSVIASHFDKKYKKYFTYLNMYNTGSILFIYLFILFYFYCNSSTILKYHIFADDTNILHANKCPKTLEKIMNNEFKNIQSCLIANKLTVIIKHKILFHSCQRNPKEHIDIKLFDFKS